MTCVEFLSLLPQYPDLITDDAEKAAFLLHAAQCPDCAKQLAEHEEMLASLKTLDDDLEVPSGLQAGWRSAVEAEAAKQPRPRRVRWQGFAAVAATLVLVLGGTALMRNGFLFQSKMLQDTAVIEEAMPAADNAMPFATALPAPMATDEFKRSEGGAMAKQIAGDGLLLGEMVQFEPSMDTQQNEPIILHSASVNLESTQYDIDIAQVLSLVSAHEGWIEYQSVYGESLQSNPDAGRHAYLRTRIPTEDLTAFLSALAPVGNTTGSETVAEDVSASYYDTQGRLDMYIAQRERLTELLAQAENMSDIITIESRMSEVQYNIDSLTGRLHNWDARAQSAVVSITIQEVPVHRTHTRPPLRQRLSESFTNSLLSLRAFLADVLVFLVMAAPYIVCVAVVGIIGYTVYRIIKKRTTKGE